MNLPMDGLVERPIHDVVPPRVDCALTPLGRSLLANQPITLEFLGTRLNLELGDDARVQTARCG